MKLMTLKISTFSKKSIVHLGTKGHSYCSVEHAQIYQNYQINHSDLLYPPRQNVDNKSEIYIFEILVISGLQIYLKIINFRRYIFNLYNFGRRGIRTCYLWITYTIISIEAGSNPESSEVVKVES